MNLNVEVSGGDMVQLYKNVLIVEDEPLWSTAITLALKEMNRDMNIQWAPSASEALEQIQKESDDIDLIVSDFSLQGEITGMDIWKTLQGLRVPVPFLLLSGMPRQEFLDQMKMPAEEMPRFIEKPPSFNRLSKELWEVLVQL